MSRDDPDLKLEHNLLDLINNETNSNLKIDEVGPLDDMLMPIPVNFDPFADIFEGGSPLDMLDDWMQDMNGNGPPGEVVTIEEKIPPTGHHIRKETHREGDFESVRITSDDGPGFPGGINGPEDIMSEIVNDM